MKLTKRQFCLKNNFESQWVDSLMCFGIVPFKKVSSRRVLIEEDIMGVLVEGLHYVCCPGCGKKMAAVTEGHYKVCSSKTSFGPIYSSFYMGHKKKTEEQKIRQSITLKKRFQTPSGEITRNQIGEASRKMNADPDFIKKKRIKFKEVQNRPEMRDLHSKNSLEMWSRPEFKERRRKYVEDHIEDLKKSALNARSHLKKTSKLHLNYKKRMVEEGIKGFVTEYLIGPYSVDEADPLAKIVVEVDGCYWHGCISCGLKGDKRIIATDHRKESFLRNRGWLIIHIKEHELKKDPYTGIGLIKNIQEKRRNAARGKIKSSFFKGSLKVQSMVGKDNSPAWAPVSDVMRHWTPHKRMFKISTDTADVIVTEDHSLFFWETKEPIQARELKVGQKIVGLTDKFFEPLEIMGVEEVEQHENSYDVSVPDSENALLDSGILVHNSYSISGVSLDIEKSSKYQSMKDEYINEYDKLVEANKRSIKIIKGLQQPRYGVGITSALGPLNRPGVQSRSNWISSFRPTWS